MREQLNLLDIAGVVVIGEGERDEAPMLFIGEEVGTGNGPGVDIALDPLEGTTLTAKDMPNALTVIAMGPRGSSSRWKVMRVPPSGPSRGREMRSTRSRAAQARARAPGSEGVSGASFGAGRDPCDWAGALRTLSLVRAAPWGDGWWSGGRGARCVRVF